MPGNETIDPEALPASPPEPSRSERHIVLVAAVVVGVVLLAIIAAFAGARFIGATSGWDVEPGLPVVVTIEPGSSARSIAAVLDGAGVARADDVREAIEALDAEGSLRAGTYDFVTDMDPAEAVALLVAGPTSRGENTFTVVEGWTVERIIEELAGATGRTRAEFQRVLRNGLVTSAYLPAGTGIDPLARWEGLLYPATYELPSDGDPVAILGAMADEAARRFDQLDWAPTEAQGLSRYETIVIGSLIEREAGTEDERDDIASVIVNRLDVGMRLQIDATVIYALGYNPGRVTADHLQVVSPYNTYRVDGLPPTPIGAASLASVRAAIRPADTSYLFYVLGRPDGSHLFAETYEEHQANIERAAENGVRP